MTFWKFHTQSLIACVIVTATNDRYCYYDILFIYFDAYNIANIIHADSFFDKLYFTVFSLSLNWLAGLIGLLKGHFLACAVFCRFHVNFFF